MEIESFKKIKNNLYEITVKDGLKKEKYELYDDILLKYELLIDKSLNKKKLDNILKENDTLESYYDALKYLSRKMRTEKEIRNYLRKKEYSSYSIENSISRLKKEGLINQQTYVSSYINDAILLSGDGPLKIKDSLLKLGIDQTLATNEIDKIDDSVFEEKIKKIIEKKSKVNKYSNLIFKNKIKSYLIMNGYKEEMINGILNDFTIDTTKNFEKEAAKTMAILSKKYQNKELISKFKNKMYIKGYLMDQINDYISSNFDN